MCNIGFRGRMKVLIAGASGYIGRHVTSLFRESNLKCLYTAEPYGNSESRSYYF